MAGSGSGLHAGCASADRAVSADNSSASPAKHQLTPSSTAVPSQELPPTAMQIVDLEPILAELRDRREEVTRLQDEVDSLKTQLANECALFHQSLQEERYRFEVRDRRSFVTHALCCFIAIDVANAITQRTSTN